MRFTLVALLVLAACGDEDRVFPPGSSADPNTPAADYVRYEAPPLQIEPGESKMWAQWVSAPLDHDIDVTDLLGSQGEGGHHANLYATSDVQPVGMTREWQDADQLKARFVGSIGGEGGSVTKPPAGTVFRIHKGSALVMQTHYLNATDRMLTGTTHLDVKMQPADPGARIVSMFTSTTITLDLKPGQATTAKATCMLQEDVPLLIYANHMHQLGTSIATTLTVDGQTTMLKQDSVWDPEWAFNSNFAKRAIDTPLVLPAGGQLETTCTWMNDTAKEVRFPDEMCVFFTLYLGDQDITCLGGAWLKT
jgi:hypothetical protein